MSADPVQSFAALQSVDRVLDVLEAFAGDEQRDLGISECASIAGINKSTVYRILATFERRGYARQNVDTGRYTLTQSWWRLGRATLAAGNVIDIAAPYMRQLRDKTRETVHLAVYNGAGTGTYVNSIEGTQAVRSVSPIGLRFPAFATSTGKALLATQPDAELQRVARKLKRFTEQTIADRHEFLAEMESIRRNGHSVNRGEYRHDVCGVAVPIHDPNGAPIAAIGICVPRFRFEGLELSGLVALLRRARTNIEREIGSGEQA
jgi:IclR family KDG regulon transcriptional repressor